MKQDNQESRRMTHCQEIHVKRGGRRRRRRRNSSSKGDNDTCKTEKKSPGEYAKRPICWKVKPKTMKMCGRGGERISDQRSSHHAEATERKSQGRKNVVLRSRERQESRKRLAQDKRQT